MLHTSRCCGRTIRPTTPKPHGTRKTHVFGWDLSAQLRCPSERTLIKTLRSFQMRLTEKVLHRCVTLLARCFLDADLSFRPRVFRFDATTLAIHSVSPPGDLRDCPIYGEDVGGRSDRPNHRGAEND